MTTKSHAIWDAAHAMAFMQACDLVNITRELTGDTQFVAAFCGLSPEHQLRAIELLQREGNQLYVRKFFAQGVKAAQNGTGTGEYTVGRRNLEWLDQWSCTCCKPACYHRVAAFIGGR